MFIKFVLRRFKLGWGYSVEKDWFEEEIADNDPLVLDNSKDIPNIPFNKHIPNNQTAESALAWSR